MLMLLHYSFIWQIPKYDDKDVNEALPGLGFPGTIEATPAVGAGTLQNEANRRTIFPAAENFILHTKSTLIKIFPFI